jgi:hypothetical protein
LNRQRVPGSKGCARNVMFDRPLRPILCQSMNSKRTSNTDLRKFLDTSVSSISGHIAGASYRAGEAGAQATAQSERTKPVLVANRFHAISQASMMSAKLRNTELASQWLRR